MTQINGHSEAGAEFVAAWDANVTALAGKRSPSMTDGAYRLDVFASSRRTPTW